MTGHWIPLLKQYFSGLVPYVQISPKWIYLLRSLVLLNAIFSSLSYFRNSREITKAWNNHKRSCVIIYHEISMELMQIKNKDVNAALQHEAARVSISKRERKPARYTHSIELLPLHRGMKQSQGWMPATIQHIKWNGMRSTLIG